MANYTPLRSETVKANAGMGDPARMPASSVTSALSALPAIDLSEQVGAASSPVIDSNLQRLAMIRALQQRGKPTGATTENPIAAVMKKYQSGGGGRGTV